METKATVYLPIEATMQDAEALVQVLGPRMQVMGWTVYADELASRELCIIGTNERYVPSEAFEVIAYFGRKLREARTELKLPVLPADKVKVKFDFCHEEMI
jgi:hypothetical protein